VRRIGADRPMTPATRPTVSRVSPGCPNCISAELPFDTLVMTSVDQRGDTTASLTTRGSGLQDAVLTVPGGKVACPAFSSLARLVRRNVCKFAGCAFACDPNRRSEPFHLHQLSRHEHTGAGRGCASRFVRRPAVMRTTTAPVESGELHQASRRAPTGRGRPRVRLGVLGVGVAVAAFCAACLPPPPPPPPPLPNAPVGASAGAVSFDAGSPSVAQVLDFPDPFVMWVQHPPLEGVAAPENPPPPPTYYAYATGSGLSTLQVATSTDLVHWTWRGDPFSGPDPGALSPEGSRWANLFAHSWGPAVLERPANPTGARFVMYYAAQSNVSGTAGDQCIGRAVSASPLGPFTDTETAPLLCTPDRGGSIDPNPVVATDGSVSLLWKSEGIAASGEPTRIWSSPLSADGLSITGASTELLETLGWSWEPPIVEAPSMMPAPGGGYLLFYSADRWQTANYKVGVAWCANLASPCTRIYATPVLASRDTMAGPGGGSVFQDSTGKWWMAFHAWTAPNTGYSTPDSARSMRLLPVTFPHGDHNPQVG